MTTGDIKDLQTSLLTNPSARGMHEMFDLKGDKIEIKTDLKDSEIKLILKLQIICEEFGIKKGKKLIDKYMRLRLSANRKSRKEIIDMIKGDIENENKKSLMNFMGGNNGGMR